MSLMPVAQSNPIVPKINNLLKDAIGKLATPATNVPPSRDLLQAARTSASEAVSLLENNHIQPLRNSSRALTAAKQGVELLDSLFKAPMSGNPPMPRIRIPAFDAHTAASASLSFQEAVQELNRHHL